MRFSRANCLKRIKNLLPKIQKGQQDKQGTEIFYHGNI